MVLPPDQDKDLKAELAKGTSGFAEITENLSKIDAETAEATVEQAARCSDSQKPNPFNRRIWRGERICQKEYESVVHIYVRRSD